MACAHTCLGHASLLRTRAPGLRFPPTRRTVAMAKDALAEADAKGAFKRTDSTFRDIIEKGGRFEPEGERREEPARARTGAARGLPMLA